MLSIYFCQLYFIIIPRHLKSALIMLYPPFKKLRSSVRPSVCPSVHPSVLPSVHPSVHHFHALLGKFQPIFFKLAMKVDIGKESPGIADG